MVHRGMLPRPRRHFDDREGRWSAQGAPQGIGAAGDGRPEHQRGGTWGCPEGGGYYGDTGDGGTGGHGRHGGALSPTTAPLVPVREDVVYALKRKGGAVADRLYPGDGPLSLLECLRQGPSAQLRPLHGVWLPAKILPDRAKAVPRGPENFTIEATTGSDEIGWSIRGSTEGRPKSEGDRGKKKRLDLYGDVETCRQESLRAPGSSERTGHKKADGKRHQRKPGGG